VFTKKRKQVAKILFFNIKNPAVTGCGVGGRQELSLDWAVYHRPGAEAPEDVTITGAGVSIIIDTFILITVMGGDLGQRQCSLSCLSFS